jgi:hypothetical protein
MIGAIGYLIACLFVAFVLTMLYALTRPINARGEMKSWRVMISFFVAVVVLPYVWGEVLTKLYGQGMKEPVEGVLADLDVNGGLRYYRVIRYGNGTARVIAVGEDRENWGGTEQPVIAITLKKAKNGEWAADSYTVVSSLKRNADSMTFPPYW